MRGALLSDFQVFLITRRLTDEKHAPFYARWMSRFIAFPNHREHLDFSQKKEKFLGHLSQTPGIADWQKDQAQIALKLYFEQFNKSAANQSVDSNILSLITDKADFTSVLKALSNAIRIKRYSYKTERSYMNWAKRFFYYLTDIKKKDLKNSGLDSEDARDYLSFLALRKKVSSSTQNQAFNALLFLFRGVLKIEIDSIGASVRAKRSPKLPVVLTPNEIKEIFKHISGKEKLILQLLYGAGMRIAELACLRVKDIDFESNLIFIRSGKGDKDRTTILPEHFKADLRYHLQKVKNLHEKDLAAGHGEVWLPGALERKYPKAAKEFGWQFAFPSAKLSPDRLNGNIRRFYLSPKTIQNAMSEAVKKAGIFKHATVHTLRHSFATHLLINGVNIREVQNLLGHNNVETPMIYTHVLRSMSNAPTSPLDVLYAKQTIG